MRNVLIYVTVFLCLCASNAAGDTLSAACTVSARVATDKGVVLLSESETAKALGLNECGGISLWSKMAEICTRSNEAYGELSNATYGSVVVRHGFGNDVRERQVDSTCSLGGTRPLKYCALTRADSGGIVQYWHELDRFACLNKCNSVQSLHTGIAVMNCEYGYQSLRRYIRPELLPLPAPGYCVLFSSKGLAESLALTNASSCIKFCDTERTRLGSSDGFDSCTYNQDTVKFYRE